VVEPVGAIEVDRLRPWSIVLRVPIAGGIAWFKQCSAVQAFEPRLTADLFSRWPDRVAHVLAHDIERAWLLMADAGRPISEFGNAPEIWLRALPRYAELQRGEVAHVREHLAQGVPDLRLASLPERFEQLLAAPDLPLAPEELRRLRAFGPRFQALCEELSREQPRESIQHDDLHLHGVFLKGEGIRFLDWGDASVAHPFASLVVTFRFLEQVNHLPPGDPWFARLRDAYLEPWGAGLEQPFARAMRVGTVAHAVAWLRQREALPLEDRPEFDTDYTVVLRRAVAQTVE
jgi:phosphotransferase family enzyme